jgi:hypothetical protein
MTDDTYNRRAFVQLQRELAELDTPAARYQAQLDRWYWEQREAAEEEKRLRRQLDPFNYGHWR